MARFFRRGPRGGAEPEPARRPREPKPDPDKIGISGSVPFVRLPEPGTLFAQRARRLEAVATGSPLGDYLRFLGRLAEAQAGLAASRAADGAARDETAPGDAALRAGHGMPLLSRHVLDDGFSACLDDFLARLDDIEMPKAARAALATLRGASPEDRLDLALQVFEGALPVERIGECVFAAAALQVFLAERAARLDAASVRPVADGVCPCCGGAPTASVVVSWTPADKARYLACSLCGSLWNHVRIRCTACGSGEGISYYGLDEVSKDVQAETCTTCHSYIKHLHQHRDPALDPIADDVASYGLDLKIAEEGFRRAGLNLLFVM